MKKIFVFDTSVLAYDPLSFKEFKNTEIIIPITVLDELDKLKSYPTAAGKNARIFIKTFDKICSTSDVRKPIKLENGIVLKIDTVEHKAIGQDKDYGDNKILASALSAKKRKIKGKEPIVTLVTRDINLRIRARAQGLLAEHYEKERLTRNDLYTGIQTIKNLEDGFVLKEIGQLDLLNNKYDLFPHECVHFIDDAGDGIAIGRRIGDRIRLIQNQSAWGIEARNLEQAFALNMLLDPKLPLVSMIGRAGTGKTLLAVAAGLEMVLERRKYEKLIIYRPIQEVGNGIGFLPGSKEEKLGPWMGAVMDSFELLFGSRSKDRWQIMLDQYVQKGRIEMDTFAYIRGRSINNALIIVDECQNIKPEDMKTILTRVGFNTKIVLVGDVEQLDSPSLDAINNGLTYAVENFKKSQLAGHITFTKGERSPLATEASELL